MDYKEVLISIDTLLDELAELDFEWPKQLDEISNIVSNALDPDS